jgi:hypothetical protein
MSVKIRPYRKTGRWEVDIKLRLPDGSKYRERSKAPVDSKSGALHCDGGRIVNGICCGTVRPNP